MLSILFEYHLTRMLTWGDDKCTRSKTHGQIDMSRSEVDTINDLHGVPHATCFTWDVIDLRGPIDQRHGRTQKHPQNAPSQLAPSHLGSLNCGTTPQIDVAFRDS